MLVIDNRKGELETQDIVFVKAISLESVYDNRRLQRRFEVNKTKDHLFAWPLLAPDQAHGAEADERPKDMSDFTFRGVDRNAFDVDSVSSIFGNRNDRIRVEHRLKRLSKLPDCAKTSLRERLFRRTRERLSWGRHLVRLLRTARKMRDSDSGFKLADQVREKRLRLRRLSVRTENWIIKRLMRTRVSLRSRRLDSCQQRRKQIVHL